MALFCKEYLVDLNASAAAVRAGYSESSAKEQASQMMADPRVKAEIQRAMDERADRVEITADYVLSKIKETIERCSQAEKVMIWDPIDKMMVDSGEWKFEHNGVLKGCELLGKHLKLFTEKHEVSGKLTLEDLIAGSYDKPNEE